jgi:hypothetical protein
VPRCCCWNARSVHAKQAIVHAELRPGGGL